jgi:hypothetical protein
LHDNIVCLASSCSGLTGSKLLSLLVLDDCIAKILRLSDGEVAV